MSGKRLKDPSLVRTNFTEAIANNAEMLADWDGLTWARPISVSLLGNAWFQGSYDTVTWNNEIENDHDYLRVSTDGGTTWRVIDLTGISAMTHDPVTVGTPDGGLSVTANQVLTLNPASGINAGSMSSSDYTKLSDLKFDYLANVGGGVEIFKDYSTVGQDRTFNLKTLVAGTGVILTPGASTITIDATGAGGGEVNTASNVTTDGIGVFDGKVGVDLQFRGIASLYAPLTVTLDDTDNDIDLNLDETLVDHDNLLNFVVDEHINHSSIEVATDEGIAGGGDLTVTRTLTLSFDTLTTTDVSYGTDIIAFYRTIGDTHYGMTYLDFEAGLQQYFNTIYTPLTRQVNVLTGLSGGGNLNTNISIGLAFNNLSTVPYNSSDYVPIYDVSNGNHAKVTLASIIGELAVSITAGNGMNFSEITSTGAITLGTPSTLTESTTNQATGTTHTHAIDLSTFELDDLGDVPAPTALYYLRRNAGNTAYEWIDPAIGASTPGGPDTSIQFNNSGAFSGNAGLLYDIATDSIYFTDANASLGNTLYFGTLSTEPYINRTNNAFTISNYDTSSQYIHLKSNRLLFGDVVSEPNYYLGIIDPGAFEYSIWVKNNVGSDLLMLKNSGEFYLPELSSAVADNVLYYNTSTGLITFGAKPTSSGGIQTIVSDSLSGLMVNDGNTSSAAIIELDQNDNKLTLATPALTDYIGFYDVSESLQSKNTLSNIPSWDLNVNSVLKSSLKLGSTLNIAEGAGINLQYSSGTLTISSEGSSGGGCSQLVADLGTVSGGTVNLDMNVYTSAIITLSSGGTINLSLDNLEEGDTGHIEVTHTGAETLMFSSSGATVKIAGNSYQDDSTVALSGGGGIDIVAYWFAKGNLHLACIYGMG